MTLSVLAYALWLGILTAVSPCPLVTNIAAISLIGHHAGRKDHVLLAGAALPGVFGVGTALPVLAFALLLAFASQSVGKAFDPISHIEKWVRLVTGTVLILAGLYYCLTPICGVGFGSP